MFGVSPKERYDPNVDHLRVALGDDSWSVAG
jgi:hypothetical protein